MNFLSSLRERLAGAIHHHPAVCEDTAFGQLEELDGGRWHTLTAVEFLPGMEPIEITIDTEHHGEKGSPGECGDIFDELREQYQTLREEIGSLLCKATPKAHSDGLWGRVTLGNIAIWRNPETAKPVVAMEYFINESPEYVYTIRLEAEERPVAGRHWRAVDVIVTG